VNANGGADGHRVTRGDGSGGASAYWTAGLNLETHRRPLNAAVPPCCVASAKGVAIISRNALKRNYPLKGSETNVCTQMDSNPTGQGVSKISRRDGIRRENAAFKERDKMAGGRKIEPKDWDGPDGYRKKTLGSGPKSASTPHSEKIRGQV